MGNRAINYCVGATYKGLLHQVYTCVVKDPHAQVAIWSDDVNCVHDT